LSHQVRSRNSGANDQTGHATSKLIATLAIIGCAGALISIISKGSAAPLGALIDAASLRNDRAQQLLDADTLASGPFSALAILSYPAGFCAIFAAILNYERLTKVGRVAALAFVPLTFIQSIAAGGRSGIIVLVMLTAVAAYMRWCRGVPAMPRSSAVKWFSGLLIVAFLVYSSIIWIVRSELSELTSEGFLVIAEESWGITISPALILLADSIGLSGLVQNIVSTAFYFTQALSVTERVIAMPTSPVLLGAYHNDLVAAAMRLMPESRAFMGRGYETLLNANVYGFFTGAWSALYIDYDIAGAAAYTIIWGTLTGFAYKFMKRGATDRSAAAYGFSIYTILISFVSPPTGFSNSAMTLAWFMVFFFSISPPDFRKRRRLVTA